MESKQFCPDEETEQVTKRLLDATVEITSTSSSVVEDEMNKETDGNLEENDTSSLSVDAVKKVNVDVSETPMNPTKEEGNIELMEIGEGCKDLLEKKKDVEVEENTYNEMKEPLDDNSIRVNTPQGEPKYMALDIGNKKEQSPENSTSLSIQKKEALVADKLDVGPKDIIDNESEKKSEILNSPNATETEVEYPHGCEEMNEEADSQKSNSPASVVHEKTNQFSQQEEDYPDNHVETGTLVNPNSNIDIQRTDVLMNTRPNAGRDFSWSSYLRKQNAIAAPTSVFEEITKKPAFPTSPNKFSVGTLLESIDPLHQSLFCVVSVVEAKAYRLRLHFEGYSSLHDFWVNADDRLIFPCEFCKRTGRKLQPPKGYTSSKFYWKSYTKLTGKLLATDEKFPYIIEKLCKNATGFKIGDKLEAENKENPQVVCVATVLDIISDMVLIHLDGWGNTYDFWCTPSSNYIHPVGWSKSVKRKLTVPQDCTDYEAFTWSSYLKETKSKAAAKEAFKTRDSHGFKSGMKLEVVDKRNPILIRVATVIDSTAFQIKIRFDGWDKIYDHWMDIDNPNLHPAGWCEYTGHPLEREITKDEMQPSNTGCPIPGCRGIGHIKGSKFVGHHSEYGCPYSVQNLDSYPIQDRISPRRGPKPSIFNKKSFHILGNGGNTSSIKVQAPSHQRKRILGRRSSKQLSSAKQDQVSDISSDNDSHPGTACGERPAKQKPSIERCEVPNDGIGRCIHRPMLPFPSITSNYLTTQWTKNANQLPGENVVNAQTISSWSADKVAQFVIEITGQEKHGQVFLDEEIDGEAFLMLTRNDISRVLNIKLGPTLKIQRAIVNAKSEEAVQVTQRRAPLAISPRMKIM